MSLSVNMINKYLYSSNKCEKILINDGIISPYFEVHRIPDFFNNTRLECNSLKSKYPQIGKSFSLLKNFDHYQYIICTLIPDIPDTDHFKKLLQKLRFLVIYSITKFIQILENNNFDQIEYWNLLSGKFLEMLAEIVNYFRNGSKFDEILNEVKIDENFINFLELDLEKIDKVLDGYYL